MKHFSQTVKIGLALLVALFSNGLLPAATAYATEYDSLKGGTLQPVWCKVTGNDWKADLAANGNGKDGPLTIDVDGYDKNDDGQIVAHDRSDKLDAACAEQYATQRVTAVDGTFKDDCGTEFNLTFVESTTLGVNYTVIRSVNTITVTATAEPGYVLTNPEWSQHATDELIACPVVLTPVTAEKPTKNDLCETAEDTYIIPSVTGVIYMVGDEVVAAGEHPTGGAARVEVTAKAAAGYELEEGKTKWTLKFTDKKCQVKVTICHATNAVKNPYKQITVNESAVDGIAGNSGKQVDHYSKHTGPIYYAGIEEDWGDIIPPVEGIHDGLNWTTLGQFILDNDCQVPAESTVQIEAVPCVINNTTPEVVRVNVVNTADDTNAAVTYQVTLDGQTKTVVINDGDSGVVTFDNIASGIYTLTVTGSDGTDYTKEDGIKIGVCAAPIFSPADCDIPTASVIVTFDSNVYRYTISGTGIVGEAELTSGVYKDTLDRTGTYTVRAYAIASDDSEDLLLASWTHVYGPLICDGGQGEEGGEETPAPVTPVTPLPTPAELPRTGTPANGLLIALSAAIATYGAVYFAQPKRRYE
ncbi:hypothetical protein EOL96_04370 [Candidatus Saccharibacteria bacterium]|nr:hypothetical protein [Candidatus Saccharibacteria bacterium]